MIKVKYVTAALTVLMTLVFVSGTPLTQEIKPARGAELLAPLKKNLKLALMAGMQKGPLNAVSVCKDRAPGISESLAVDGVQIGRTSHRLRNPANVAPEWVDPVLRAYLEDELDRTPRVLSIANNREGYVEPITIKPLCLACHAETLSQEVEAQIKSMYPQDEATGFKIDELRGVYWVDYPTVEHAPPLTVTGE